MNSQLPDSVRIERMRDLENKVSELTLEYLPHFSKAVSKHVPEDLKQVYNSAMQRFMSGAGRWWDPWHVSETFLNALFILNQENIPEKERVLSLCTLFYHDTGYQKESAQNYFEKDERDRHMRVSAHNIYSDLFAFRNTESGLIFSRDDLSTLFDAVIKHDDKYKGQKPSGSSKVLQLFQDMDTTWIPSFLSAVQNYAGRYGRPDSNMTPEEFLQMRQSYFFDMGEEIRNQQTILISQKSNTDYSSKKLSIAYPSTKRVIAAEMLARAEERNVGIFDYVYNGDWSGFQKHAKAFLDNSIEAAKQGTSYDMLLFGKK
jgi:hypothetical protein